MVVALRKHRQTCTGETLRSGRSKLTRAISFQLWPAYLTTSQSISDMSWYHKLYLPWISFDNRTWHPMSQLLRTTTATSTTTACHLLPWAVLCNFTSNPTDASHGVNIQATAGTSRRPRITTDATSFSSRPRVQNESPTPSISNTSTSHSQH